MKTVRLAAADVSPRQLAPAKTRSGADSRRRLPDPQLVLGIMSGTSIGSTDYALCQVTARSVRLVRHWQVAFPPPLGQRLHAAARGQATSWELGQLHHDLGRFYAAGARDGLKRDRPALVGLHGQTVFHHPPPPGSGLTSEAETRVPRVTAGPATLQIGEPAWLCETLRVPVVSNFRAADLAAGGQGAPLATLFHRVVFGQPGRFVCVNNLGGISNVTALDWRRPERLRLLAFDTGPANVLLDLACRQLTGGRRAFDKDGAWAARGTVHQGLLDQWLKHPYFRQPPPKSTGRELFGEPFLKRVLRAAAQARLTRFDLLATLVEFTAQSIALNYRWHLGGWPQQVVLAGGGAANPVLVGRITACLGETEPAPKVITSDALGWPTQAIEPAAFALLAYYRVHSLPGNLPETTGARRAARLGQITAP